MRNSTGNADKKSTITNKNDKTEEEHWNRLRRKEKKNTTIKIKGTTKGNKADDTDERKKTKKILRQKTIQTK